MKRTRHNRELTETTTVAEAARLLGINTNTLYAAAARGEIPTIRIGRLLLIPKLALTELLRTGRPFVPKPQRSIDPSVAG
jgi:excisionase family DNA binding protein